MHNVRMAQVVEIGTGGLEITDEGTSLQRTRGCLSFCADSTTAVDHRHERTRAQLTHWARWTS